MNQLPPFSGDHPRCRKCGLRGADTEWVPYQPAEHNHHHQRTREAADEHLRRTCIRCGYSWREDIVKA